MNRAAFIPTLALHPPTLGVDYGNRHTGISRSIGINPIPLPPLSHRNPAIAAQQVEQTARAHLCSQIVVGMPLDLHGNETEQARRTRIFLRKLVTVASWASIYAVDERFTTQDTNSDSEAACAILQRFFNGGWTCEKIHQGVCTQSEQVDIPRRKGWKEWRKEAVLKAKQTQQEL